MTDDESAPLSAKSVRHIFSTLQEVESSLYEQATLLHRLFYKSKAQHRSAKWFQSISGMRKCFARLLNMSNVSSKIIHSLPDRGVACKGGSKKKRKRQDVEIADAGSLELCKDSVAGVWDSLWGEETKDASLLTKYDTRPSHEASMDRCRIAAKRLLLACMQMEELACRARTSFQLMELHLRTPPAATFAPLVVTILAVCAEIQRNCDKILWTTNKDSSAQVCLSEAYSLLIQGSKITSSSKPFLMDARGSRGRHGAAWEKMLTKVNASNGKDDMAWLPVAIIQSSSKKENQREVGSDGRVANSTAKESLVEEEERRQQTAYASFNEGDEDLGEAL